MQAWFHDADPLADKLTSVFNLIAAGQVPASIVPLLTAGRGVAIPKPVGVWFRPVVVGSIILRFIGTAVRQDYGFLLLNRSRFNLRLD